jgi:hypothetical protein
MIRVDRGAIPEPAALSRTYTSGRFKGKTEAERVAKEHADHIASGRPELEFTFDYERYRDPEVKRALETLFKGKCAYCESRYAGTQPVDVEHWRPKGKVHERGPDGTKVVLAGYHWLASTWDNLLPSCIDCNRERTQRDFLTGQEETLGKANQFPVDGPRMIAPIPGNPSPALDRALLLNPCTDEPAEHLEFHDDGAVIPANASPLGIESIRVYALNRTELALDRFGLSRLIEQRLHTIEGLANVIVQPDLPVELRRDLEDLLSHEIDTLLELGNPDRPFSALAQQLINQNAPS